MGMAVLINEQSPTPEQIKLAEEYNYKGSRIAKFCALIKELGYATKKQQNIDLLFQEVKFQRELWLNEQHLYENRSDEARQNIAPKTPHTIQGELF